jgi:hypothetical protein
MKENPINAIWQSMTATDPSQIQTPEELADYMSTLPIPGAKQVCPTCGGKGHVTLVIDASTMTAPYHGPPAVMSCPDCTPEMGALHNALEKYEKADTMNTPDSSLPPLAPEGPRRDMLIRISVSADFEKRLDNQWEVEREIQADRWSWKWADAATWFPIESAPKDGTPFLGVGCHEAGSFQLVTCFSTAG